MNFHQLRVFYEVAKASSFSAAADKLCLTQPAVTWQIRNLEDFYDLKFFERVGKKVLLTEEGKILFDYADRILNLSRQAEEALADLKGLSGGTLKIGATFSFADYYLPVLLDAFHKKYPKIAIQISTGNTPQIIETALLHKNDLAFVAYDPKNEKLVAREFASDQLEAIVCLSHPFAKRKSISLKDLRGQPLILRELGSSKRRMIDEVLREKGITPTIIMESASTSAIKKMVESGVGVAILSRQVVKKEVQAKAFKELPFTDASIAHRFYLIHHKDKFFSQASRAFMDLTLEYSANPWPD